MSWAVPDGRWKGNFVLLVIEMSLLRMELRTNLCQALVPKAGWTHSAGFCAALQ